MANSLTTNPLVFDTVGATSLVSTAAIITSIVWDSGDSGAVGDNVVLHNSSGGDVVFQATLAVAKDTIVWLPASNFRVTGLYLTTLDNGKLLVYLA